jgi:hypothetical protein
MLGCAALDPTYELLLGGASARHDGHGGGKEASHDAARSECIGPAGRENRRGKEAEVV